MVSIKWNDSFIPKIIGGNQVNSSTYKNYVQMIDESEMSRLYPGYDAAKEDCEQQLYPIANYFIALNVSGFVLADNSPFNDELMYDIVLESENPGAYGAIVWYNPDTNSFVQTLAPNPQLGFTELSYSQKFEHYTAPPAPDNNLHYLDNLGLQRFKANIDENLNEIKRTPVTTSGTGAAYVAQVKGINASNIYMVPVGTSFTMIPHTDSTTVKPTLNVNGLGAREIRVKSMTNNDAAIPTEDKFLLRRKPVDVMFDGTYWVCDMTVVDGAAIGLEDIAKKAEDAENLASSAEDKAVKLGNDLPVQIRTGVATAEIVDIINDVAAIFILHTKEQLASMFDIPLNEFYPEFCFCSVENANTELFVGLVNIISKADSNNENIIVAADILTNGINTDVLEVTYTYIYTTPTKIAFAIRTTGDILRFYNRPLIRPPRVGDLFDGLYVENVYLIDENKEYNKQSDVPWSLKSFCIDYLSFKDKISPISTAYWFAHAYISSDINFVNLDMSRTINASHMFDGANMNNHTLTFDANMLTPNANMSYMFANVTGSGKIVFDCEVPNGTNMSHMFANVNSSIVFGDNVDTSGASNMSGMFRWLNNVPTGVYNINTSNVTDMSYMFEGSVMPENTILNYNTSNVTNMSHMFNGCQSYTGMRDSVLNIFSFDTSSVTDMSRMFSGDYNALPSYKQLNSKALDPYSTFMTILVSDKFITDNVVNSDLMFDMCEDLTGGSGTEFDNSNPTDKTYARIDNPPTEPGYFTEYKQMFAVYSEDDHSLDFYNRGEVPAEGGQFEGKTASSVYMMDGYYDNAPVSPPYYGDDIIKNVVVVDFKDEISFKNQSYMFAGFENLAHINNIINFNINSGSCTYMFSGCKNLTSVDGIFTQNFSSANLDGVFSDCIKLKQIDLSGYDGQWCMSIKYMFYNCQSLKTIYINRNINIDGQSTDMFYGCVNLIGGQGTKYNQNNIDKEYARIDSPPGEPGYFTDANEYNGDVLFFNDDYLGQCPDTNEPCVTGYFEITKAIDRDGNYIVVNESANVLSDDEICKSYPDYLSVKYLLKNNTKKAVKPTGMSIDDAMYVIDITSVGKFKEELYPITITTKLLDVTPDTYIVVVWYNGSEYEAIKNKTDYGTFDFTLRTSL